MEIPDKTPTEFFHEGVLANRTAIRRLEIDTSRMFRSAKDRNTILRNTLKNLESHEPGFAELLLMAFSPKRRSERKRLIEDTQKDIQVLQSKGRRMQHTLQSLKRLNEKMMLADRACRELGHLPDNLEPLAENISNMCLHAVRTTNKQLDISRLDGQTRTIMSIVGLWSEALKIAEERRERHADAKLPRIFLPIPRSLENEARYKGAGLDPSQKGSRVFVTPGDNLALFERMLPTAYRKRHTVFDFPPIPPNAAGQNLRTIFDAETWDHIRKTNYERTGYRCIICGGRHGQIAKYINSDRDQHNVDCHEVWSWKLHDDNQSMAIQTLEEILVVCVDCHMMMHTGFAKIQASRYGAGEEVARFLMRRQMMANKMDEIQITDHLEKNRATYEAVRGANQWVIDLTKLASQDYMSNFLPVFVEDNSAGLAAKQIAGIQFSYKDGAIEPARDLKAVLNASASPANVLLLRKP